MPGTAYDLYTFGSFTVDVKNKVLMRDGKDTPLPPKASELLLVLLEKYPDVARSEELEQRIWPEAPSGDENRLARLVNTLRKTLGDGQNGVRYIETVSRQGYRLVAEISKPMAPGINNPTPGDAPEAPESDPKIPPQEGSLVLLWQGVAEIVDATFNAVGVLKDAFVEAGEILLAGFEESGRKIARGLARSRILLALLTLTLLLILVQLYFRINPGGWIPGPVVASIIGIVAGVLLIVWFWSRWRQRMRVILVLPFVSIRPSERRPGFDDGMTSAVIRCLIQIKLAHIRDGRQYGADGPIRELARKAHAGGALEGKIEWQESGVYVSVTLFARDGVSVLWPEKYEEALNSASDFAVQEKIARRIAADLEKHLKG